MGWRGRWRVRWQGGRPVRRVGRQRRLRRRGGRIPRRQWWRRIAQVCGIWRRDWHVCGILHAQPGTNVIELERTVCVMEGRAGESDRDPSIPRHQLRRILWGDLCHPTDELAAAAAATSRAVQLATCLVWPFTWAAVELGAASSGRVLPVEHLARVPAAKASIVCHCLAVHLQAVGAWARSPAILVCRGIKAAVFGKPFGPDRHPHGGCGVAHPVPAPPSRREPNREPLRGCLWRQLDRLLEEG